MPTAREPTDALGCVASQGTDGKHVGTQSEGKQERPSILQFSNSKNFGNIIKTLNQLWKFIRQFSFKGASPMFEPGRHQAQGNQPNAEGKHLHDVSRRV